MKTAGILFMASVLLISCNSEPVEQITGAYVREYSFEEKNMYTGKILGQSTTRDTIYITKKKEGYEVNNSTWRIKDYDEEGWRKQMRTVPAYIVTYDETDHSLNPVLSGIFKPFYLDLDKGLLYKGQDREDPWVKVK